MKSIITWKSQTTVIVHLMCYNCRKFFVHAHEQLLNMKIMCTMYDFILLIQAPSMTFFKHYLLHNNDCTILNNILYCTLLIGKVIIFTSCIYHSKMKVILFAWYSLKKYVLSNNISSP